MIELTPSQAIPLIARMFKAQPGRAIGMVGAPGMAKTAIAEQVAAQMGRRLLKAHPVVEDPTDVRMPWVVDRQAEFLPMGLMKEITKPDCPPTIVLIDDLGQATPVMQASYMQPVHGGELAGMKISPNVSWLIATNRRKDKAGVGGVLAPLTNRVTMIGIVVDADSWCSWWLKHGEAPVVAAYVRFKPDCLKDPEKMANRDIEPFCSARGLEAAGRYISAGIREHAAIAGCIGDGRATELVSFLKIWEELPDIDDVLAKPDKAAVPGPKRPDVLYALIGALAYHVDAKRMGALCTYLERIPPEFQVACIKDAQSQKPELRKTKALIDWLLRHKDMLGLANGDE